VLLIGVVSVNVLFYHLLKAPTMLGRRILDKIEGFKMFLAATEADRLQRMYAVDRTPELYEKFLPYALALNVNSIGRSNSPTCFPLRHGRRQRRLYPAVVHGLRLGQLTHEQFRRFGGKHIEQCHFVVVHRAGIPFRRGRGRFFGRGGGGGGGGAW